MATPFISYRVTLNSRKTQDLFEISLFGNRTNSALSPMLGFIDKFVMFVLLLVRHVFFWVIIILHRRLEGWVGWNNRLKRTPRGSCCWIYFPDVGLLISKTTTIYKPMRINGNNSIRKCTKITDYRRSTEWNRRSTEWLYHPICTVYALRLLGKILIVIVLPISDGF